MKRDGIVKGGFIQVESQPVEVMSIDRRWRDAKRASVVLRCAGEERRLIAGDSLSINLDVAIKP